MKSIKLSVALLITFTVSYSQNHTSPDQREKVYNNVFSIGLYQAFNNTMALNYERHLNHNSFHFSSELTYLNKSSETIEGLKFILAYRIYFQEIPKDYGQWYFTPGLEFKLREYSHSGQKDQLNGFGIHLLAGAKFIIAHRLILDMNTGVLARHCEIKTGGIVENNYQDNYFSPGYSGIGPTVNICLGFLF